MTQQTQAPLQEQHLTEAGVPARAVAQARAFGLDPSRLLALLAKYGPVVFQLLEELTHAGGGGGGTPAGAQPGPKSSQP